MRILLFFMALLLVSCGVKLPPNSPVRPTPPADLDCSIYDPSCEVHDPRYDPACDPSRPSRPAICEEWNKKYEAARVRERIRKQDPNAVPSTRLEAEEITP